MRSCIRLTILAAVAALGVPAGAHAQNCRAGHSHTVLRTAHARVYWQGSFRDRLGHRHHRYYGCAPHGHFGRYPFNQRGDIGIVRVDPRTTEVLYTDTFSERGRKRYAVVRDAFIADGAREGHNLWWRIGGVDKRPAITGLVSPFGQFPAFAVIDTPDRTTGRWEVRSSQIGSAGGKLKVIDSGTGIAPNSLRLHGKTLSWRHTDGSTRTATLDGG